MFTKIHVGIQASTLRNWHLIRAAVSHFSPAALAVPFPHGSSQQDQGAMPKSCFTPWAVTGLPILIAKRTRFPCSRISCSQSPFPCLHGEGLRPGFLLFKLRNLHSDPEKCKINRKIRPSFGFVLINSSSQDWNCPSHRTCH